MRSERRARGRGVCGLPDRGLRPYNLALRASKVGLRRGDGRVGAVARSGPCQRRLSGAVDRDPASCTEGPSTAATLHGHVQATHGPRATAHTVTHPRPPAPLCACAGQAVAHTSISALFADTTVLTRTPLPRKEATSGCTGGEVAGTQVRAAPRQSLKASRSVDLPSMLHLPDCHRAPCVARASGPPPRLPNVERPPHR